MKHSFLLFILFFSLNTFAQYENYKLEDYVNPDYKRQELDFGFDAAGGVFSLKNEDRDYDYKRDMENKSLSGNTRISYRKYKNSLKFQGETLIGLSLSGSYNNNNDYDDLSKKLNSWGTSLNYSQKGFYYLENNKSFIEFSPTAAITYSDLHSNQEYSNYNLKEEDADFHTNLGFDIGAGTGRIEYVEDARQAVYILQDLQKRGLLKRTLTNDEIHTFAQQITQVKMKRQFDHRIRLIEEISTVDSFLVANDYIEKTHSAPYFTSLYDNWMYAGLIQRKSGSRFSVGITPNFRFSENSDKRYFFPQQDDLYEYDMKNHYSELSGMMYVDYTYEKPVNLYWQNSAKIRANGGWGEGRYDDYINFRSNLYGYYGVGYYPNSRTSITGSISERLYFNNYSKYVSTDTQLGIDVYYYLSPQLRIGGNYGLSYSFARDMDDNYNMSNKYPNSSFNVSFTYSIF